MASLNLKDLIVGYIRNNPTEFKTESGEMHDRSQTVGGSEIGMCMRHIAFRKMGAPEDEGYENKLGFAARGKNIEDWVVTALRASFGDAKAANDE